MDLRNRFRMSSFSLRTILIMLIVFIVIIPDVFIFSVVYKNVSNALQNSLNDNATNSVRLLNENITQFMSKNSYTINKLSQRLSGDFTPKKNIQELLNSANETDNTCVALTMGNINGQYIRSPSVKLTKDIRQEQWYKQAMAHAGKVIITPPFVSTLTKEITVIVAKTTPDKKAVISMDIDLSALEKITNQVKVGDHGYAFLLDENGNWVANPKSKPGNKVNSAFRTHMLSSSNGIFDDTSKGNNNRIYYATNPLTGWKIGGVMSVNEINNTINPLILTVSLFIIIVLAVIVGLTWLFILFKIIRPLNKFVHLFSKISSGDLTQQLGEEIKVNKEFTELSTSTNYMIGSLHSVMENINQKSETLAASSEELTASTEENKATSDEVAHSIQEIALGASDQSEKVSKTGKHADAIYNEIETITLKTNTLTETADQASETVNMGTQSLRKVTEQMNLITSTNNEVSTSLDKLIGEIKEIEKMNDLINDIAEQTNLLSLNASIEAARAGAEGRGFAVVAEEIRKLAQQSQQSSKLVSNVVSTIKSNTTNVIESMKNGTKEVKKGINVVADADHSFGDIQNAVKLVGKEIRNVSESVKKISLETESVVATFDRIAQLASNASSNSESVTAAAEEQSASMEEVAGNATALSNMADELHQLVSTFKLRSKK